MRTIAIALLLIAGCAIQPNRYEQEWNAYVNYLRSEVQDGRMSRPQAEYLATMKRNELVNRSQADRNAAIGAAAAYQNAQTPYPAGQTRCFLNGNVMTCR